MACDRESVYAALFARLQAKVTAIPARNWTRRYDDYTKTSADQQPCAIVVATHQDPENRQGLPSKWTLNALVRVWGRLKNADDRSSPDTTLNGFITAIEAALDWDSKDSSDLKYVGDRIHTTLGGLCSHAWVASVPEIIQGTSGDQAEADIMIEMLGVSAQTRIA